MDNLCLLVDKKEKAVFVNWGYIGLKKLFKIMMLLFDNSCLYNLRLLIIVLFVCLLLIWS